MEWDAFFQQTIDASGLKTNTALAQRLQITQQAVSHYRTGRRVPPVWTVAQCLQLQGHPEPEREAARIMLKLAHSAPERAFWRRLGAAAALAVAFLPVAADQSGNARNPVISQGNSPGLYIMFLRWLKRWGGFGQGDPSAQHGGRVIGSFGIFDITMKINSLRGGGP